MTRGKDEGSRAPRLASQQKTSDASDVFPAVGAGCGTFGAGETARVIDDSHYKLPAGLQDGDAVKLLAFDHGYWTVEKDGRQFAVFKTRLDSGSEYELGGWLPESDWRVKAFKE